MCISWLRFTFASPNKKLKKTVKVKAIQNTIFALFVIGLVSCGNDDLAKTAVTAPVDYQFERNGANTVSFSGQTTRIMMAEELVGAMSDFDQSVMNGTMSTSGAASGIAISQVSVLPFVIFRDPPVT